MVVGKYKTDPVTGAGLFRYAASYAQAGLSWAIDPVNLPFIPGELRQSQRYGGPHDVLRDACPDSWGQTMLRREHGLPESCTALRYLVLSGNGDRWGALAIGASTSPNVAKLPSPAGLRRGSQSGWNAKEAGDAGLFRAVGCFEAVPADRFPALRFRVAAGGR